jgi:hypothetical protein
VKVASTTLSIAIAPVKMSCALFLIAVYISGQCVHVPATGAGSNPDARDADQTQQEMRIDAYLTSQEKQLEEIREGNANLNAALDQLFQASRFEFWSISSALWQPFDLWAYTYLW